jgi:hypothetical protein
LPRLFSSTIVPISARNKPINRLLFSMQSPQARVSSRHLFYPTGYSGGKAGFVSPQAQMRL